MLKGICTLRKFILTVVTQPWQPSTRSLSHRPSVAILSLSKRCEFHAEFSSPLEAKFQLFKTKAGMFSTQTPPKIIMVQVDYLGPTK